MFALFYGLDWIATVPPTVKLAAQQFGKERAGMIFGWVFAAHQLGAAVAAYGAGLTRTLLLTYDPALFAAGFARTLLLTYTPALYTAGAACLFAALIVMAISRPAKTATAPAAATTNAAARA